MFEDTCDADRLCKCYGLFKKKFIGCVHNTRWHNGASTWKLLEYNKKMYTLDLERNVCRVRKDESKMNNECGHKYTCAFT